MASGKNEASKILSDMGWKVIDADIAAHTVLDQCSDKIISAFKVLAADKGLSLESDGGKINRRALGELLFSDPALLKIHESIIYPRLNGYIEDFIQKNDTPAVKGIVLNAAVLYKIPALLKRCKAIIYVTAPAAQRLVRSLHRDSMKKSVILQRFYAQRNLISLYKENCAPDTKIVKIWNTGTKKSLAYKICKALIQLGMK